VLHDGTYYDIQSSVINGGIVKIGFDRIEDSLSAVAAGEAIVVLDDKTRENEGDLIIAAEHVTTETMAFFVRHTTGIICVALLGERLDSLELPPMVAAGSDRLGTAFTVSVDGRHGTTTGVSAADRARTIAALIDPSTRPEDLLRPGHMFPLRARGGGVLERRGHTEAAVDLARLAGLMPAGVLCEIVNQDGSMARAPELLHFARYHDLRIVQISELVQYREHLNSDQPALQVRDRRPLLRAS
jgi:3,4-dihydroxy 2-butanone 4-phosphate synthase / GTP cyclohydrolase II